MPGIIDVPEIVEETQGGTSYDTIEVTLSLNPTFVNKITDLLSGTANRRRQCAYLEAERHDASETVVDMLARQHPYIYIKALAG